MAAPGEGHLRPDIIDRIEHEVVGAKIKLIDPRFIYAHRHTFHPLIAGRKHLGFERTHRIGSDLAVLVGHIKAIAIDHRDILHTTAVQGIQTIAPHTPCAKEDHIGLL